MNRLVLIGNGFDLAHGLKTSYADFIDGYWEQRVNGFCGNFTNVSEDSLCKFEIFDNIQRCWNVFYYQLPRIFNKVPGKDVVQAIINDKSKFKVTFSPFFERIIKSINTKRWVDIENEYYSMLVNEKVFGKRYRHLNEQLECLRDKLIEYLKMESGKDVAIIEDIMEKIYRPIERREVVVSKSKLTDEFYELSNIMLLNFNYTTTPERYMEGHSNVMINYIHGRLDDPQSVIFGYGDELDEDYNKLKEQDDNECLRYVKSIRYLEKDNYRRMQEFIESEPFQVVIMGHSCGKSDRTLLNTLFEHPNCVSIKPYYYIDDNQQDNFGELSINIHRNFTDMRQIRARVVNKTYTEPLTKHTK